MNYQQAHELSRMILDTRKATRAATRAAADPVSSHEAYVVAMDEDSRSLEVVLDYLNSIAAADENIGFTITYDDADAER